MVLKATKVQQGATQGALQTVLRDLIRMMLSKGDSMKVDSCKVVNWKMVIRSHRLESLTVATNLVKDTD